MRSNFGVNVSNKQKWKCSCMACYWTVKLNCVSSHLYDHRVTRVFTPGLTCAQAVSELAPSYMLSLALSLFSDFRYLPGLAICHHCPKASVTTFTGHVAFHINCLGADRLWVCGVLLKFGPICAPCTSCTRGLKAPQSLLSRLFNRTCHTRSDNGHFPFVFYNCSESSFSLEPVGHGVGGLRMLTVLLWSLTVLGP